MLKSIAVQAFKSLQEVEIELGQVNVFIGANGSGKSNILEALGVLSAAADGRVDDQRLLLRGVRPGVPALYKSSFRKMPHASVRAPSHLFLSASTSDARYEVTLRNPLKDPRPAWGFKTEVLWADSTKVVGRSPNTKQKPNPEQGLAALQAVELAPDNPAFRLLQSLQQYAIFTPTTSVLRGISTEPQPRAPVGLSGGLLPRALYSLMKGRHTSTQIKRVLLDARSLIDWARAFGTGPSALLPLSPAAAASPRVIKFIDRYMNPKRNVLSGYDASEGALYVLFLAVLAAHPASVPLCAVDNADHGLNPRLARRLMERICSWYLNDFTDRQILLTTHNPLVLDGLFLQDDRVRLFTVSRDEIGRTIVRRIEPSKEVLAKAAQGWTLSRLWVMGHLGGVPDV